MFEDRLADVVAFADVLAGAGIERGLIGPREVPRLWERHLINCGLVTDLIGPSAEVLDVGSGAGLPGLVLALRRPDLTITLVEPLLRRATFLEETVELLGLTGVTVRRARAEELHGVLDADVVTARAVAPLAKLTTWCLPLVRPGGELLAMKGSSAEDEIEDAAPALRRGGARGYRIVDIGEGLVDPPTRVVAIESGRAAAPRRAQPRRAERNARRSARQRRR